LLQDFEKRSTHFGAEKDKLESQKKKLQAEIDKLRKEILKLREQYETIIRKTKEEMNEKFKKENAEMEK